MQRNTELLLGHLQAATPAAETGIGFHASDSSGVWAMSTQTLNNQLTGRIILTCDDTEVLWEFAQAARDLGYTIQTSGPANTILITPYNVACPLMCDGCPILPAGVRARLIGAETITAEGLRRYQVFVDNPDVTRRWAGRIRITAKAVSSDDGSTEAGTTAVLSVNDPGTGADGIADLIRKCPGPKRFTDLLQLIFFKRVCGCLGPQLRRDL